MITHELEIRINRPVEDVFAALTDLTTYPRWQPGLMEYRQTSAGPLAVGSTGIAIRTVMGQRTESTWQVTELTSPTTYTVKGTSSPLAYEIAHTLQPAGDDDTTLHMRFQAQPTGLLKIAEPVLAGAIKRDFEEGHQHLKALLEGEPARKVSR
ncbi:MAG TPA: SRPBCC family protein [Ktedonobacterales bacterium]|nr:SRPBCC family protein [Ktedonobacterales bacterium]